VIASATLRPAFDTSQPAWSLVGRNTSQGQLIANRRKEVNQNVIAMRSATNAA
jgi:hypothetical protein